MRLSVALGCLLLVGCARPHSTDGLWAQRLVDQETVLFQLSDAQRAERLRVFEIGLVDDTIGAERARIEQGLTDCPGPTGNRQPVGVSVGDRTRDAVRIQAQDDATRMTTLAQIALADWYARRARATGDARFCVSARQALAGEVPGVNSPDTGPLADALGGTATVCRDPSHAGTAAAEAGTVNLALSNYALGYVDTLRARAPLPQYLAAVYGGVLLETGAAPVLNGASPESLVDQFAPAYPEWEPDALYAALSAK